MKKIFVLGYLLCSTVIALAQQTTIIYKSDEANGRYANEKNPGTMIIRADGTGSWAGIPGTTHYPIKSCVKTRTGGKCAGSQNGWVSEVSNGKLKAYQDFNVKGFGQ